jgi:hypothetical protein
VVVDHGVDNVNTLAEEVSGIHESKHEAAAAVVVDVLTVVPNSLIPSVAAGMEHTFLLVVPHNKTLVVVLPSAHCLPSLVLVLDLLVLPT